MFSLACVLDEAAWTSSSSQIFFSANQVDSELQKSKQKLTPKTKYHVKGEMGTQAMFFSWKVDQVHANLEYKIALIIV